MKRGHVLWCVVDKRTLLPFSGIFMFLWSMALTCKHRAEKRDTSSQKLMTTSFNN